MSNNNLTGRPFRRGQKVVSITDRAVYFTVAACFYDETLKRYRFAPHGGGTFDCIYFKISDQ